MNTPAPPKRRRAVRIAALALGLIVVILASAPWWFNAERVAALAIAQADSATGLDWRIEGTPQLRWKPLPWLALPRLSARDAQGTELFSSESVAVSVPWSTLRGDALVIDAVEMDGPRIDVDAVRRWLDAQPASEDAPLPTLTRWVVRRGQLNSQDGRLEDVALDLSRLAEGQEMRIAISGVWVQNDARNALSLRVSGVPRGTQKALRFENLRLALTSDGGLPNLDAEGELQWSPTWALALQGRVSQWPAHWGDLPEPLADNDAPFAFAVTQSGADALAAPVSLSLSRNDVSTQLLFQPEPMRAWWNDAPSQQVPPLTGKASLPALTIDGVRMEGIEITVDESPTP